MYVELMQILCGYRSRKSWDNNELRSLDKFVKACKQKGVEVFSDVQCFEMGTLKCHLLDHISDGKHMLGYLHANYVAPAEHLHYVMKNTYLRTSKRHSSAVDDFVNIFSEHPSHQTSPLLKNHKTNGPNINAITVLMQLVGVGDTAKLVHHYISVSMGVLMSTR